MEERLLVGEQQMEERLLVGERALQAAAAVLRKDNCFRLDARRVQVGAVDHSPFDHSLLAAHH